MPVETWRLLLWPLRTLSPRVHWNQATVSSWIMAQMAKSLFGKVNCIGRQNKRRLFKNVIQSSFLDTPMFVL